MLQTQILNDDGKPIILNDREVRLVEQKQQMFNSLGFDVNITSLTAIAKKVTEQKFYEVAPAKYMPIRVGEGTWSQELLTYRSYNLGGNFESGIINLGTDSARAARADAGIDQVTVPITNWRMAIGWNIFEVQEASKAGNWDLVTQKEISRKTEWDLGIQKIAFLGLQTNPNVYGLLTQPDVNSNTAIITKYISSMTSSEFNTLLEQIMGAYQINANYTRMPSHFTIPYLDYVGLASFPDATYPLKTKLEILRDAFRTLTMNPAFEIQPVAYADQVNNATMTGLNKNRYTLYRGNDDTSLRMDLPLDYNVTIANTFNGMDMENIGYGQFTGARAYRPLEMLYFDWAA